MMVITTSVACHYVIITVSAQHFQALKVTVNKKNKDEAKG